MSLAASSGHFEPTPSPHPIDAIVGRLLPFKVRLVLAATSRLLLSVLCRPTEDPVSSMAGPSSLLVCVPPSLQLFPVRTAQRRFGQPSSAALLLLRLRPLSVCRRQTGRFQGCLDFQGRLDSKSTTDGIGAWPPSSQLIAAVRAEGRRSGKQAIPISFDFGLATQPGQQSPSSSSGHAVPRAPLPITLDSCILPPAFT